ncbi:MAG TPA: hypothetical protein VFN30_09870 [Chitinophagaceae bacterium]|nr:hypothetical protein [Chitinophagaceae bacterium]
MIRCLDGYIRPGERRKMHDIEPYYNWRHLYTTEEDEKSPFYGRVYSEFEFTQTIYNYYIHPQWDEFGSRTLYLKVLMVDYEVGYAVIELIGEWNDAIENDVMTLKREVIDKMEADGIIRFILIAENVLNFHSSDDCYYEEWHEETSENGGWVVILNMPEQIQYDFNKLRLRRYLEVVHLPNWRTYSPFHLYTKIDEIFSNRIKG